MPPEEPRWVVIGHEPGAGFDLRQLPGDRTARLLVREILAAREGAHGLQDRQRQLDPEMVLQALETPDALGRSAFDGGEAQDGQAVVLGHARASWQRAAGGGRRLPSKAMLWALVRHANGGPCCWHGSGSRARATGMSKAMRTARIRHLVFSAIPCVAVSGNVPEDAMKLTGRADGKRVVGQVYLSHGAAKRSGPIG